MSEKDLLKAADLLQAADLELQAAPPSRARKLQAASPSRARKFKIVGTLIFAAFWFSAIFFHVVPSLAHETGVASKYHAEGAKHVRKNVIFMVSDGMGPASISLARSFRQFRDELPFGNTLALDKHMIGSSRTLSDSSLVTDSAAGAVAFASGQKTYNGAIGVNPYKVPIGTILEAAKLQRNYKTGLVVTTRLTDATPAAFSAHADYRFQEDLIAQQQLGGYELGRVVDLLIGGGRCHFHPVAEGGCRADATNLIVQAQTDGWQYVSDRASFDKLGAKGEHVQLPLLALLAEGDIPYDLDRNASVYPSLKEETTVAMNALLQASLDDDTSEGFFLLVEGSRIDHAGHHNDPAAQVREVLAYDETFQQVLDFVNKHSSETEQFIVLSTSDHETGGLATSRQISPSYPDYVWYPEALDNASHSGEYVAAKLRQFQAADEAELGKFIGETLRSDLGIVDYTEDDIKTLSSIRDNAIDYLNNLVSFRSRTGWSTHGHSAVDVNIYGYSPKRKVMGEIYENLAGNHENIEIGQFMQRWVDVDISKITQKIKNVEHSPKDGVSAESVSGDAYHFNV
ncbi:hypothetical protein BABINDRAFT_163524 [Babjeviella inositovora NRRL Y-12698]|uniref:alkaline phosphatase n=1 Tax=Babjeviella inositovora NRRL Y-12698 TaxID=984486 RepID=A0A1E3QIJ7_9ASCO|nr:uncharacterized protein BABINDRAFT_163524 [Babjeviella inositovora NRRL Y-12698]ODQ77521.1 hypothetical protein BABINDRAFT_163524 [Babjeviella inositovora NRRL Y-12698]